MRRSAKAAKRSSTTTRMTTARRTGMPPMAGLVRGGRSAGRARRSKPRRRRAGVVGGDSVRVAARTGVAGRTRMVPARTARTVAGGVARTAVEEPRRRAGSSPHMRRGATLGAVGRGARARAAARWRRLPNSRRGAGGVTGRAGRVPVVAEEGGRSRPPPVVAGRATRGPMALLTRTVADRPRRDGGVARREAGARGALGRGLPIRMAALRVAAVRAGARAALVRDAARRATFTPDERGALVRPVPGGGVTGCRSTDLRWCRPTAPWWWRSIPTRSPGGGR